MYVFLTSLDFAILDFIYKNMHTEILNKIMPKISALGNVGALWILIAIIMLCIPEYKKCAITLSIGLILSMLICNIGLKPLFARARPFEVVVRSLLISPPKDYSFPSGHTVASFISSVIIYNSNRKIGIIAFVLAILIAYSRLYLYVHYPSDVLAGIALGVYIGFLAINITKFIYKKVKK